VNSEGNDAAVTDSRSSSTFLKSFFSFSITFVLMAVSWLVLSGKFEPLLLFLGGVSCFIVSYFFHDLLFPDLKPEYIIIFLRFIKYCPWLIWEIVKANFHLLYLSFHPRMNELIEPQIITFETGLKSDIAIATLANSITLTPGTITVTADKDGVFQVHAIDNESAEALPGVMLEKVAKVFGEKI
jgi:multicomponent Na+:H+ antiporter subunit E